MEFEILMNRIKKYKINNLRFFNNLMEYYYKFHNYILNFEM